MRRSKAIWLATSASFFIAAAAAAQTSSAPSSGQAQAALSAPDKASSVDAVVVTGIRASTERAVKIKQNSDQIIDTVSATEIGELPDFNAGDALKRVTGIDYLSYQGEPRFITVRGFDENYDDFLIDGFSLAATDLNSGETTSGGRQVDMELLPSNIASHIDVIKSALPEDDANWIGGLTNFVAPSAYDFKNNAFSLSVEGGAALQRVDDGGDKPSAQAELAGAKRFGSDGQFGIYVSATYWLREIDVPQLEAGGSRDWFTSAGAITTAYGGTGYAVPSQRLFYNYQDDRDRFGYQGRLDWRPSSTISGYINAYSYHQDERDNRNDLNAAVASASQDLNQTVTTGQLTSVAQDMQVAQLRFNRDLDGLYGRLSVDLGDWKADFGTSWSLGHMHNPQTFDEFQQSGLQFNYNTTNLAPTFTPVNLTLADNYSKYTLVHHEIQNYGLNENRYDEQINISNHMAPGDSGFGLKFGARVTGILHHVSLRDDVWTGGSYTLANVLSGQTLCGFGCNTPIPLISPGLAAEAFNQYKSVMTDTPNLSSEAGGDYAVHEVVAAGYGEAKFKTKRWIVTGGLRLEGTFTGSSSTSLVGKVYEPVSANKEYYNVLPSVLFVYNTSYVSKLRLSASETVSRPTFASSALHDPVLTTTSNPPTLASSNPNLDPRTSENFDAGHDWYFDHGHTLVSVAAFYKLIHHDIFTYGTTETVAGVSEPVSVTEPLNSSHLVHDAGIEGGYSQTFSFLPAPFDGLGVSANATLSHAHYPVTLSDGSVRVFDGLPEQADEIYNASVFYDKGRIHGRFAWNHLGQLWDDRYPNFTPAAFYANRFQQPTNNFDIQLSYDVTPHIAVSVIGLNLSQQGMFYKYGYNQELYQSAWALPSEIMFGIKIKN